MENKNITESCFIEWEEIESIEYYDEIETVDISCDGDHLFFGNDILTHNTSYSEIEFDPSHMAGGISKVNTADNVLMIYVTPAMKENGRYQIQFAKTRSSAGVGSKVELGFDPKTLRIRDLEEGEETALQSQTKNIMDTLRKTSVVNSEKSPPSDNKSLSSVANVRDFLKRLD